MAYVDGLVIPVPEANREVYRAMAARTAPIFREYGAEEVIEGWGTDIKPGETTDFFRAVKAEDGETVVFSWIRWPSKEARDAAWQKIMSDERMRPEGGMPFDGKRMFWGGFEVIVEAGE